MDKSLSDQLERGESVRNAIQDGIASVLRIVLDNKNVVVLALLLGACFLPLPVALAQG